MQGKLDDEFMDYEIDEYKRPLSLLFNIFICTQVANEINARRINDEYDIFSGLFTNWIFMAVLAITMGAQVRLRLVAMWVRQSGWLAGSGDVGRADGRVG